MANNIVWHKFNSALRAMNLGSYLESQYTRYNIFQHLNQHMFTQLRQDVSFSLRACEGLKYKA